MNEHPTRAPDEAALRARVAELEHDLSVQRVRIRRTRAMRRRCFEQVLTGTSLRASLEALVDTIEADSRPHTSSVRWCWRPGTIQCARPQARRAV